MDNRSRAVYTTYQLLTWLVPLLVFFLVIRTPNDNDMWWHLRAGQDMVIQRTILTHDQFSYTRAGQSWVNAFWLADILIYLTYRAGGFFALSLAAAGLSALTLFSVFRHSDGPLPLRAVLILIAGFGLSAFSAVRPQLFSFLFLAFLDQELRRVRWTGRVRPYFFICLFVLWANIHGGYIWGLLLFIAFIAGEILNRLSGDEGALAWKTIRQLSLWGLLSGLATIVNPNGPALWKLPFYTVQVSITKIGEWASPDFHRVDIQPMLWFTFLLILGLGFSRKKLNWDDALKYIGFIYIAFVSQRGIGPFLVVAVPIVSVNLTSAWNEHFAKLIKPNGIKGYTRQAPVISPGIARIFNGLIIGFMLIACLARTVSISTPQTTLSGYPAKAVEWIRENKPEGKIFNSYNWGGYLTWSLPEYPVFIDGRADLYGDELMNNWWDVVNGTNQGMITLNDRNVRLVLLEPGWAVENKLPAAGWQLLYSDDISVVYGR